MVIIKDRREQQEAYAFFRIVSEAPGIVTAVIIDEIAVDIFMFDYDGGTLIFLRYSSRYLNLSLSWTSYPLP